MMLSAAELQQFSQSSLMFAELSHFVVNLFSGCSSIEIFVMFHGYRSKLATLIIFSSLIV